MYNQQVIAAQTTDDGEDVNYLRNLTISSDDIDGEDCDACTI